MTLTAEKRPAGRDAIISLLPYQRRYIQKQARLKGWRKARQIGGSFAASLEVVLDALQYGEDWNMMSRSGRQAKKLLAKAVMHAAAIEKYNIASGRRPLIVKATTEELILQSFAGRPVTIAAMPCDPDTTAGDCVSWLLDEFDLFPQPHRIFAIVKPSILRGKKLRIISTARNSKGKMRDLYRRFEAEGEASGWWFQTTTIEEAVIDGLILRDEQGDEIPFQDFRRAEIEDIGEEMYLQEYMCVWLDALSIFLTTDECLAAQSDDASDDWDPAEFRRRASGDHEFYLGVDVGRKKDLTVIWATERRDGTYTTRTARTLHNVPLADQESLLRSYLASGAFHRALIDKTGIGFQLAENMEREFPGIAEGLNFTGPLKRQMAHKMRNLIRENRFHIPADRDIVDDFTSVVRTMTDMGLERITAPSTVAGHADRFWASAMAIHAGESVEGFELAMA